MTFVFTRNKRALQPEQSCNDVPSIKRRRPTLSLQHRTATGHRRVVKLNALSYPLADDTITPQPHPAQLQSLSTQLSNALFNPTTFYTNLHPSDTIGHDIMFILICFKCKFFGAYPMRKLNFLKKHKPHGQSIWSSDEADNSYPTELRCKLVPICTQSQLQTGPLFCQNLNDLSSLAVRQARFPWSPFNLVKAMPVTKKRHVMFFDLVSYLLSQIRYPI